MLIFFFFKAKKFFLIIILALVPSCFTAMMMIAPNSHAHKRGKVEGIMEELERVSYNTQGNGGRILPLAHRGNYLAIDPPIKL